MDNLELIAQIALLSASIDDFQEHIKLILSLVGQHTNVSRVNVIVDDNCAHINKFYEWCNQDVCTNENIMRQIKPEIHQLWKTI